MADGGIPHGLGLVVYIINSEPGEHPEKRADLFADHLAYVNGLEKKGVLFAAGPLVDETDTPIGRGMIVVRAKDAEEASEIAFQDPFHKNNVRQFSVQAWRVNEGRLNVSINYSDGTCEIS
jgi:uncharacterized protein YciI